MNVGPTSTLPAPLNGSHTLDFVLFLLLFTTSIYGSSTKPISGKLSLQLFYTNEDDRDAKGDFCDFVRKECEPILDVCLSTEADSKNCDIYSAQTPNRGSTKVMDYKFTIQLQENLNTDIINLKVEAKDYDNYNSHDLIGKFTKSSIKLKNNGSLREYLFRVKPSDKMPRHAKIFMEMSLECNRNYFGYFCQKFCESSGDRYTCSPEGDRICLPGYKGSLCTELDPCATQKCAEHATCIQDHQNLSNRICKCTPSNEERAECYPNYNPCQDNPCMNGGRCTVTGKYNQSFSCECPFMYTGYKCWKRRFACQEMARNITLEKFNLEPDAELTPGELESVCHENGECLEKTGTFGWECKCNEGFSGLRCQETSYNFLLMGLTIGMMVLLTAVLVLAFFLIRHRRKLKEEQIKTRSIYGSHHGTVSSQIYARSPYDFEDPYNERSLMSQDYSVRLSLTKPKGPDRELPPIPTPNPYHFE